MEMAILNGGEVESRRQQSSKKKKQNNTRKGQSDKTSQTGQAN